jgi:hypothetical protein
MSAARTWAGVLALGVVLAASGALGCGSSGNGPPPALSIDPMDRLVDLTSAGKATLCDWLAAQVGGYGHSIRCEGIATSDLPTTDSDQAACVAQLGAFTAPKCPTTVGQFASCVDMDVSHCDFATVTSPDCSAVTRCYGMPGG